MELRTLKRLHYFLGPICAAVLPCPGIASLPQPPILIYGKVTTDAAPSTPVTSGLLEWTYTPAGGNPLTISTELQALQDPANPAGPPEYSYSIQVPLEMYLAGYTPTGTNLSITATPVNFTRSAAVNGQAATIAAPALSVVALSTAVVGTVERVDLTILAAATCCPGDGDSNHFTNTDDYRSVRDRFGQANPAGGDTNCDHFVNTSDYIAVRDNFGHSCSVGRGLEFVGLQSPVEAMAGAAQMTLTSPGVVDIGQQVTVTVQMDSSDPVMLAGVFLAYDRQYLRFVDGQADAAFNNSLLTNRPTEVTPGIIAFSAGAGQTLTGSRSIAQLHFQATASEGSAALELLGGSPYISKFHDGSLQPLQTALQGTTIKITNLEGRAPESWSVY